jgi:hypothetical protein
MGAIFGAPIKTIERPGSAGVLRASGEYGGPSRGPPSGQYRKRMPYVKSWPVTAASPDVFPNGVAPPVVDS